MNAALSLILFLLGSLGLVLFLFSRLRQHSHAGTGVLLGALFMLIPVVTADLQWLRLVLGLACFALWLLLAVYWMNFRPMNRIRRKRNPR